MTAGNSVALDFRFRLVVVRVAVGSWEIRTWPKINHKVSSKQPERRACIAMRTKITLKIGNFICKHLSMFDSISTRFPLALESKHGREGGRESDCGVNFACDWSHMSIRSWHGIVHPNQVCNWFEHVCQCSRGYSFHFIPGRRAIKKQSIEKEHDDITWVSLVQGSLWCFIGSGKLLFLCMLVLYWQWQQCNGGKRQNWIEFLAKAIAMWCD